MERVSKNISTGHLRVKRVNYVAGLSLSFHQQIIFWNRQEHLSKISYHLFHQNVGREINIDFYGVMHFSLFFVERLNT